MKRRIVVWVLVALVLGFLAGVFATRAAWPTPTAQPSNYSFLAPEVARLDLAAFNEQQRYYHAYYTPLRTQLREATPDDGTVAVYFEDLTTGEWIGIEERTPFRGASLLKIVTIATTLRAISDGTLAFDTRLPLAPGNRDDRFGSLYDAQPNATFTVEELIAAAATSSDNTAANALHAATGMGAWWETFQGLGLPPIPLDENITYVAVTAKGYSTALRNLYYSGYLRRRNSEYLLSLLAHTEFTDALSRGVPTNVPVAHKIGVYTVPNDPSQKQYHDCGIVYTEHPYILCVLTHGIPEEEAKSHIARISTIVYTYNQERE